MWLWWANLIGRKNIARRLSRLGLKLNKDSNRLIKIRWIRQLRSSKRKRSRFRIVSIHNPWKKKLRIRSLLIQPKSRWINFWRKISNWPKSLNSLKKLPNRNRFSSNRILSSKIEWLSNKMPELKFLEQVLWKDRSTSKAELGEIGWKIWRKNSIGKEKNN